MNRSVLSEKFVEKFGVFHDKKYFFAPGRINLIGEHIDYNGGFVFPTAITYGTYAVVSKRLDKKIRLYSQNFSSDGIIEIELNDIEYANITSWAKYVIAVILAYKNAGHKVETGFDAYIEGNIPNGAGLSSSASLEILTGIILQNIGGYTVDKIENAKLGQIAENDYVGVKCGIMDQFAIAMGEKNKAILLNTEDLVYDYVNCDLSTYDLLIMNTNKKRGLADSKYNTRRAECEAALSILKRHAFINNLCDLTRAEFDKISHYLTDDTLLKRARHAVTENERVKLAVNVLKEGNLFEFGQLLNESHKSLKDDYEVTGIELDTIVELASNEDGVIGARMTGAGFGGCAIALVEKEKVAKVIDFIERNYTEKIGYKPSFYIAKIASGAKMFDEDQGDFYE